MINRGRLFVYRLLLGILLLVSWEASSGRIIDPFWVSSPSLVFKYLYGVIADGSIFAHLAITLYETFTGFLSVRYSASAWASPLVGARCWRKS